MKRPIAWLLCAVLTIQSAGAETLAVLYPDLSGSERQIFNLLREGVRAEASRHAAEVLEVPIQPSTTAAALSARLRARKASQVIALGRRSWELSRALEGERSIRSLVVGAVKISPGESGEGVRGISATVNPRLVLTTLRELGPRIRRIHVVIDPQRDGWLKVPTIRAANELGLSITFYGAKTVREAAAHYLTILRDVSDPESDALWLLDNASFVTSDTLPAIMERSWTRRVVVFSNVLEHVSKGALFALVPEPKRWGQRLARQLLEPKGTATSGIEFLEDVRRVGNLKAASHLGRRVDLGVLSRFEIVVGQK